MTRMQAENHVDGYRGGPTLGDVAWAVVGVLIMLGIFWGAETWLEALGR